MVCKIIAKQGTVLNVIISEQINMDLSNDRGKNALVSLQFSLLHSKLIVFYFVFIAVPIALIPLEAAIKRRCTAFFNKIFSAANVTFPGYTKIFCNSALTC